MKDVFPVLKTLRLLLKQIKEDDINNVFTGLSNPNVVRYYGVRFSTYGAGGINNLNRSHRKAEIELWLLPQYLGNRIMQEAVSFICNQAFDNLNMHRIEGFVESGNVKCKRAPGRLDFIHEGTMQDCEI